LIASLFAWELVNLDGSMLGESEELAMNTQFDFE
jgi:hypothetical protein